MGAGTGFRVMLNRYDGFCLMPESFQGLVVKVDVGLFQKIQLVDVDAETVVLSGNFNFSGCQVLDRVIGPVVTEFKLKAFGPHGQSKELVAQTYSGNWKFFTQFEWSQCFWSWRPDLRVRWSEIRRQG